MSIKEGEILHAQEVFERVKKLGKWSADTIWQHLIAHIVNLTASRHHYSGFEPFLFLHEDGRYELFNPNIHPKPLFDEKLIETMRKSRNKKPEKQLSLGLRHRRKKSRATKNGEVLRDSEGDS